MATTRKPRKGSLAVWPRVRSKRETPRVRSWAKREGAKLLGFAGYKAGMTTVFVNDNRPFSKTKDERIPLPATILECPPMRIASVRFYGPLTTVSSPSHSPSPSLATSSSGIRVLTEIFAGNDPALARRLTKHKKVALEKVKEGLQKAKGRIGEFTALTLLLHTQPKLVGIEKKKPEILEIALSGTVEEQFAFVENSLGRDISLADVIEPGNQVDAKGVTKGKGFQGTTKRFGTKIRPHKTEKAKRGPGTLGPWHPAKVRYSVPQAGKMGYHSRTDFNKHVLKIGTDPAEVNPDGGFLHYGLIKNPYIIVNGSVPGPAKRLIRLNLSVRPNRLIPKEAPEITNISTESPQGN